MGILNSVINYIIQNWVSITIAILLGSIFYLLSARGIKKLITSRQEERLKIAKESIVDVLEHQIINNFDINTDKIIHLLNATSRERGVNLTNEYTSLDLLEDLELRFAKSKHLKNEQRGEYIGKIEILLKKIEDEISTIIPSYEKVLTDLGESIEKEDTESIKQNLNFLRTKLTLDRDKKKKETEITSNLIALLTTVGVIIGFSPIIVPMIGDFTIYLIFIVMLLIVPIIIIYYKKL